MDVKSHKLEPSPPLYYTVFISPATHYTDMDGRKVAIPAVEFFTTEQLKPFHSAMPPKAALALKLVEYMAIQDTELLSEVIDTVKVFCVMLHCSEVFSRAPKEAILNNLARQGISDEKTLDKAFALYRKKGRVLEEKLHEDYTDDNTDNMIAVYNILGNFYHNYGALPPRARSRPDKTNVLNYPSIQAVIELLERNLDVPEANIVLPILYILMGQIDKVIDFYESKDTMYAHDVYNLGTAYLIEKRDIPRAREHLVKVVVMERASYNLALTYMREEDWMEAINWLYISTSSLHAMVILFAAAVSGGIPYEWQIIKQRTCSNLGVCHYYGEEAFRKSLLCFEIASKWGQLTGFNDGVFNRSCLILNQLDVVEKGRRERKRFDDIDDIIGQCNAMQDVYDKIERFADNDFSVLITGETGTGKDLVAKAIHRLSKRSGRFVKHNCATIPEGLEDSELFGHEKGAFTGATRRRKGIFEQANGGTLFLDELGSMKSGLQAKILNIIEDKAVRRIGSEAEPDRVDVRILLATNENLEEAVKNKHFREDLYYRIKGIEIHLPPLRERGEDIPLLIDHFIEKHSEAVGKKICGISPDARIVLTKYSWPGNVRELSRIIQQAIVTTNEEVIRMRDILESIRNEVRNNEDMEKQVIEQALKKSTGNVLKASKELGWARTTLRRRIEKHGIDTKAFKPSR